MPDDPCWWCAKYEASDHAERRRSLLQPSWLDSDAGSDRYDALTAVDRAIWRRTRGQHADDDSIAAWCARLRRAVTAGTITADEARQATARARRIIERERNG